MQILIATLGSHGDLLPFIAIAAEFKRQGHHVHFFANPYFEKHVSDIDVRFTPIGTVDQYQAVISDSTNQTSSEAARGAVDYILDACPYLFKAISSYASEDDTVLVTSSLIFVGPLIREIKGLRVVIVDLAPASFRSAMDPPRYFGPLWLNSAVPLQVKRGIAILLERMAFNPSLTHAVNMVRSRLDLPPAKRVPRTWLHEVDLVIGLFPEWFARPQSDWPRNLKLLDFPLYDHGGHQPFPDNLRSFLDAGEPPIVFTAGSATTVTRDFFHVSVQACKKLGRRAVLVSQSPDPIPLDLPDGIIHVKYAPYKELLPLSSAFVHHGGIGSVSQGILAGVPQLIRPAAYDQFDNSMRAVKLGIAIELLPHEYRIEAVALALRKILTNKHYKKNCSKYQLELAASAAIEKSCEAILSATQARPVNMRMV